MSNSMNASNVVMSGPELMQLPPPEFVSMWPNTLAWDLLFLACALGLMVYLWRSYRAYRKDLWRRQALSLGEQAKEQGRADTWFQLIKRVALVHQDKSSLQGQTDEQLLASLGLEPRLCQTMLQAHYHRSALLSESSNDVIYLAFTNWVNSLPAVSSKQCAMGAKEVQHAA